MKAASIRALLARLAGVAACGMLGMGVAGALGGCNTTEGIGRDIEATGNAIGDAAEDAQD